MYQSRAVLSKRGVGEERLSPEPPQMTLYSKETGKFNTKIIGGDITVRNIDKKSKPTTVYMNAFKISLYISFIFP